MAPTNQTSSSDSPLPDHDWLLTIDGENLTPTGEVQNAFSQLHQAVITQLRDHSEAFSNLQRSSNAQIFQLKADKDQLKRQSQDDKATIAELMEQNANDIQAFVDFQEAYKREISQLKTDKDQLKTTIGELRQLNSKHLETLADLKEATDAQIYQLDADKNHLSHKLVASNCRIEENQGTISELKRLHSQQTGVFSNLKKNSSAQISQLKADKDQLNIRWQEDQVTIAELRNQNAKNTEAFDDFQKASKAQISELKTRSEQLTDILKASKKEIQEMQDLTNQVNRQIKEDQATIAELKEKNSKQFEVFAGIEEALNDRESQLRAEKDQLSDMLIAAKRKIQEYKYLDLETVNQSLKDKISELGQLVNYRSNEIDTIKLEITKKSQYIDGLKAERDQLKRQLDEDQAIIVELKDKNLKNLTTIQIFTNVQKSCNSRISQLREKIEKFTEMGAEKNEETANLRTLLTSHIKDIDALKHENIQKSQELAALQADKDQLKCQRQNDQDLIVELEQKNAQHSKALANLQEVSDAQIFQLKAEKDQLNRQKEASEAQILQLQDEIQKTTELETEKSQEICQLETENNRLKVQKAKNDKLFLEEINDLKRNLKDQCENISLQGYAHARKNERLAWLESGNRFLQEKVRNLENALRSKDSVWMVREFPQRQNRKRSYPQ
ncbi:hypothetical protein L596_025741 [Steinernema carpocapsae]|uniref:Uncharacterized protein n=1 Tax=Steinernema carpocapsae TaxID=34508 RepID=A0A4U5M8W3_STECR|nr:hypothetical protein L596_025741 [Steinernema carpocapsae]